MHDQDDTNGSFRQAAIKLAGGEKQFRRQQVRTRVDDHLERVPYVVLPWGEDDWRLTENRPGGLHVTTLKTDERTRDETVLAYIPSGQAVVLVSEDGVEKIWMNIVMVTT